ncbi:MAG TPA: hypothetical protein DDZ44_06215 [Syntrophomonas wolfei]|jgi:hypothetical protein|uniref:Uncharacterized protein n=1 Tax=Syntrophomonas wolfei TaxID=863 RepID=A0A354YVZ3_9FIRM|nr:hypothetical protein [Syntrophomonas wolfei]
MSIVIPCNTTIFIGGCGPRPWGVSKKIYFLMLKDEVVNNPVPMTIVYIHGVQCLKLHFINIIFAKGKKGAG